jgi:hypothetical protein
MNEKLKTVSKALNAVHMGLLLLYYCNCFIPEKNSFGSLSPSVPPAVRRAGFRLNPFRSTLRRHDLSSPTSLSIGSLTT